MQTKHLFLYLPVLFFTSCASIVSKSDWPVTLNSNPAGAKVVVKKEDGSAVHQATTPTTVTLHSSQGYFKAAKYTAEFSKKGYPTQTVPITAKVNGWYYGNILFGGLGGLLIVDPVSGAMYKLDETITADLSGKPTVGTPTEAKPATKSARGR